MNRLPSRIVIFTVAGAPYRDAFYRSLAEHFSGETSYVRVMKDAPDHAWSAELSDADSKLKEQFIPAVVIRGKGWLKRWRQGRNPLVVPTWSTWREICRLNADLVMIQEYSPVSILFGLWAKLHGRKVVTMSEIGRETRGIKFFTWVRHWVGGHLADGQLAHTLAACDPIYPGLQKSCFAPHSVEVSQEVLVRREPSEKVRLLFVGNLIERKGVDLLLSATARLVKEGYGWKFTLRLVGGGDRTWLAKYVKEQQNQVEFVGFKEKAALDEEYRDADVFVLPSRHDTFGVVAHEAASRGLALVLSEYAGSSELFGIREDAAEIVNPEDLVSFSRVLRGLIDEPVRRREMGEKAREAAEYWSSNENARRVVAWLSTLG